VKGGGGEKKKKGVGGGKKKKKKKRKGGGGGGKRFLGGGGGGGGAGILGLQNQWGMFLNCCNLRTGTSLKAVSLKKYQQCHKVEISMGYLSREFAFISAIIFTTSFQTFYVSLLQKEGG